MRGSRILPISPEVEGLENYIVLLDVFGHARSVDFIRISTKSEVSYGVAKTREVLVHQW